MLLFLIFAAILIIPYTITILREISKLLAEEHSALISSAAGENIHSTMVEKLMDSLIAFSFYTFVLAFILALFFSRNLIKPIREFCEGAQLLKQGSLSARLHARTDDELGEVICSFNDIASLLEQKTEELKRKDRYLNAMTDPVWVVDMGNTITYINPAFTALFGHTQEETLGVSALDFLDEENASVLLQHLTKRRHGLSSTYEISITSKTGEQIPVLITGAPIIINGTIEEKIGILKDFRREHQLRDAIKKSRDQLETIMDSIDDEIIVVDRDHRIIMANKAVKVKRGKSAIGNYCHAVMHNRTAPCWYSEEDCPVKRVFDTGTIARSVHRTKSSGGSALCYETVAYPIKDSRGNIINVIELMRDVTRRKENEDNIARINNELTVINNIADILARSLSQEEISRNVLEKLIKMFNMEGGGIYLLDEAGKELCCMYAYGIAEKFSKIAARINMPEDIPGTVAATGKLICSCDITADYRIQKSMFKHSGMKGFCAIPLLGKERRLGVFYLFSFKPHIFTAEEEKLMTSIGEMTGIAIENIRLYEKMRRMYEIQRQSRIDTHKSLLELSSKLATALDIDTAIRSTVEFIRETFKADSAWFLGIEDENLILMADSGMGIRKDEIIYDKDSRSIEWYAIEKNETVIVPSMPSEDRFNPSKYLNAHFRSAVCSPVYVGKKALGAMSLYFSTMKKLREDELYFLEIVSSILAISVERSELYDKKFN